MDLTSDVFFLSLNLHKTQDFVIPYGYHILIQTLTVCINNHYQHGGYKRWHTKN